MKHKLLAALCLLVLTISPAQVMGQVAAGDAVTEPGLFTYSAPAGWQVLKSPSSKFTITKDKMQDGFAANINVVAEDHHGTLAEYVAANKKALFAADQLSNVKIGAEKRFVTSSGLEGITVSASCNAGNFMMALAFFFFEAAPGRKLVVTGSCLAKDEATHAPKFENSLKTFRLLK